MCDAPAVESGLTGFVKFNGVPFLCTRPVASMLGRQNTRGWICTKNKQKKRRVILFLEAYCTDWWRMGCLWLSSATLRGLPIVFFMVGGYSCLFLYMLDIPFPLIRAKRSALVPQQSEAWSCCLMRVGVQVICASALSWWTLKIERDEGIKGYLLRTEHKAVNASDAFRGVSVIFESAAMTQHPTSIRLPPHTLAASRAGPWATSPSRSITNTSQRLLSPHEPTEQFPPPLLLFATERETLSSPWICFKCSPNDITLLQCCTGRERCQSFPLMARICPPATWLCSASDIMAWQHVFIYIGLLLRRRTPARGVEAHFQAACSPGRSKVSCHIPPGEISTALLCWRSGQTNSCMKTNCAHGYA